MKKAWLLAVVLGLSSTAMAQNSPVLISSSSSEASSEQISEVAGRFVYFLPSQQYSGFYDSMSGVEIQYTRWLAMPLGISAVTGMMNADVRANNRQLVSTEEGVFTDSARMVPFGVSALYNVTDTHDWRITGEAGVRYVFITSDIKLKATDGSGSEDVSLDDAFVAVFRVDVDRRLADQWALLLGAGVQIDLAAGDVSTSSRGKLGDDNLKGYSLSLGARYLF